MDPWAEQWARVQRWFERFSQTNSGRADVESSDHLLDEVYAFFQSCYHLKEWLINDMATSQLVHDDVEPFISASPNLTLCADLCNGSKHLLLKSPRGSADTRIGRRDFSHRLHDRAFGPSTDDDPPPTISAKYEVEAGSNSYDAFTVAEACMREWKDYLAQKGL